MQPKSNDDWKRILGQTLAERERIDREKRENEARLQQQYEYWYRKCKHDEVS